MIQLDMTPAELEALKEKCREFYHLMRSPDWTLEKQLKLSEEITKSIRTKIVR